MSETQTPTANCIRCGRVLRSLKSVSARMGRTCKAKVKAAAVATVKARYAHKPHLVAKAEEAIEAGGVIQLRGKVCEVAGSKGAKYLSHPAACNCKAGLKSANPYLCHHRIVADIFIASRTAA